MLTDQILTRIDQDPEQGLSWIKGLSLTEKIKDKMLPMFAKLLKINGTWHDLAWTGHDWPAQALILRLFECIQPSEASLLAVCKPCCALITNAKHCFIATGSENRSPEMQLRCIDDILMMCWWCTEIVLNLRVCYWTWGFVIPTH